MFARVALVACVQVAVSATLSPFDTWRAETLVPGDRVRAHGHADMVEKLNGVLTNTPGLVTEPCESFSVERLVTLQRVLHAHRDPKLQALTVQSNPTDNRRLRAFGTLVDDASSLEALWGAEMALLEQYPAVRDVSRDAKCHEALLWMVHHIPLKTQLELRKTLVLPLLPKAKTEEEQDEARMDMEKEAPVAVVAKVLAAHTEATGCLACHAAGPPAPTPEAPACLGADGECPIWPSEFVSPFGLYSGGVAKIVNATSDFYYKFKENGTQAQVIDYKERCFPFVDARSIFEAKPCKLYFVPSGIYLNQPVRNIDCCLFQGGVGAVPTTFLQAFTRVGQNEIAQDYAGRNVSCDHWSGPQAFEYWTSDHNDPVHGFGEDIVFKDGPTGVTWQWGDFDVKDMADSIFDLPGTEAQCNTPCKKVLSEEEHKSLADHVRLVKHASK